MHAKLQQLRSVHNSEVVNKTAKLQKFSPRQSTTTVAEVKDTQLEKAVQQEPRSLLQFPQVMLKTHWIARLKMSFLLEEQPPPEQTLKASQPKV